MGGSVELSKRYFGNSRFQEYNNVSITEKMKMIDVFGKEDKISIGVGSREPGFFKFIDEYKVNRKIDSLIDLKREKYNGDKRYCCLNKKKHYWLNSKGEKTDEPSVKKILYTCDPGSRAIGYDIYCDDVMFEACVEKKDYEHREFCSVWFDNLEYRKPEMLKVSNRMALDCKDNIEGTPYCKEWMESLRKMNDEELNMVADTVLKSQIDKSSLKCAFPPIRIKKEELKVITSKECWYKECIDTETWKLLTENIYRRNQCHMYECNVSINNILQFSDKSEIKIICRNKISVDNNNDVKDIIVDESKYNMFLVTKYDIVIIFVLLLMFYMCFHNY